MTETASAFSTEDEGLHNGGNGATAPGRRLPRRPTTAGTERIARGCPPKGLSIPVIVEAIRQETGCSRATAYRAIADALADGTLVQRTKACETPAGWEQPGPAKCGESAHREPHDWRAFGEPSRPVGPRQLVIFVVRAHQRPLSDLAELLVTPELENGRLIVELRMDLSRLLKPLTTLG